MRLAFFLLTLALVGVVGGVLWREAHPEWRRYQRALRDRSEDKLLTMREEARAELEQPFVRAMLSSIEHRLEAIEADSTRQHRRDQIESALHQIGRERRQFRRELREEEKRLASPSRASLQDELRSSLARAQDEYAEASALWPPDHVRLRAAEQQRDSLSGRLDEVLRPVTSLSSRLDSLRSVESRLRDEGRELAFPSNRLRAERTSYFGRLDSIDAALTKLRTQSEGVREIVSADGTVARCPTCHGDLGETPPTHPRMKGSFSGVSCTACHGGNGRALDVERAHIGLRRPAERALDRVPSVTTPDDVRLAEGFDGWSYSPVGRPLRYVGSRECLGCHETLHREHSARWIQTKFRSLARLADELHPEPCYQCHVTGYDTATGTFFEAGVTCEACHGPGELYSRMMFDGVELNGRGETGRGRDVLDLASRLARQGASARTVEGDAEPTNVCVSCHHPRRHRDGGPSILERDVEGMAPPPADGAATLPITEPVEGEAHRSVETVAIDGDRRSEPR